MSTTLLGLRTQVHMLTRGNRPLERNWTISGVLKVAEQVADETTEYVLRRRFIRGRWINGLAIACFSAAAFTLGFLLGNHLLV